MSCRPGRFHAAYVKGFDARLAGAPVSANPYRERPNAIGLSFGRAWRNAWRGGWDACDKVHWLWP